MATVAGHHDSAGCPGSGHVCAKDYRKELVLYIFRAMANEESERLCTDTLFRSHPNYTTEERVSVLGVVYGISVDNENLHVYPSFIQILDRYLTSTRGITMRQIPVVAAASFVNAMVVYDEEHMSVSRVVERFNEVRWTDENNQDFEITVEEVSEMAVIVAQTLGFRFMDPCFLHYAAYLFDIFDGQYDRNRHYLYEHEYSMFYYASLSPSFSCLPPSLQFAGIFYLQNETLGKPMQHLPMYVALGKTGEQVMAAASMIVEAMKKYSTNYTRILTSKHEELVKDVTNEHMKSLQTIVFGISQAEEPLKIITGEELDERYISSKFMGSGAYGEVWAVHDKIMNTDIALKEISFNKKQGKVSVEKRLDEMISEICGFQYFYDQEGFLKTYTCSVLAGDQSFLLFSKLYEGDLDTIFNKRLWGNTKRKMTITEEVFEVQSRFNNDPTLMVYLRTLLRPVCRALCHLHERGFTHGDVKPENILVSGNEGVLADFGFLRRDIYRRKRMAYTPTFRSPIYLSKSVVTDGTDTWAMGIAICSLVCQPISDLFFSTFSYEDYTVEQSIALAEKYISFLPAIDPLLADLISKMTIETWTMRQCLNHAWWRQN